MVEELANGVIFMSFLNTLAVLVFWYGAAVMHVSYADHGLANHLWQAPF